MSRAILAPVPDRTAARTRAPATAEPRRDRAVRRAALAVPFVVWAASGCATSGFDLSESKVRRLQARHESSPLVATMAAPAAPRPYRVQPGDSLALVFFFNPELNQTIRVQPDGAITVPLLGTRSVRGMSIPQISEMVRAAFAEELKQPQVVVQLIEATERLVYVGGAVNSPREVSYRQGLTPLEVILAAGGFAATAEANEVILIRKDRDGRPVPAIVDLEDMVLQADASFALEPWDIVFVPKDEVSKANEWVDKYLRKLLLINGISFGYDLNPDDD